MRNLTLAIEDEVLETARTLARERGTTLNQLVRDHLAELVARGPAPRRGRAPEASDAGGAGGGRPSHLDARGSL